MANRQIWAIIMHVTNYNKPIRTFGHGVQHPCYQWVVISLLPDFGVFGIRRSEHVGS